LPVAVLAGQSEHGESGEVDGCGEESEVGSDFRLAAHAGASAAVFAAGEVTDFALDGGAGGLVLGGPVSYAFRGLAGESPGLRAVSGSGGER
jgi:hypothetical protein